MNSERFFVWTHITISLDNKGRPGDERNEKKTCLYRYFLLEVRNVKNILQKTGLPRLKQIRIL